MNETTFGQSRQVILDVIQGLRDGKIEPNVAEAIRGQLCELHKSVAVEVNAAKLAFLTRDQAMNFGPVVKMGQLKIAQKGGE